MKKKSGVITKKVCVIGTGYVGLVTGTCLAEIGHKVICVDNNAGKIKLLKAGRMPIYESGLRELVLKNVKSKRLGFSYSISDSVKKSDIIFIAVGTPTRDDGSSDLTQVERVASEIARNVNGYKIVVEKSTVPVETGGWVKKTVQRNNRSKWQVDVVSNPEFLREGSAVHDFLNPDRIVLGVETAKAEKELQELYAPLKAKMLVTDIKSAEIIKHASNSFLATKISFINAVANVCERAGADIEKVSEGMGLDKRIGPAFLKAGCGFGGFCFPKDLRAFGWISNKLGYDFALLKEVDKVNQLQKELVVRKLEEALWVLNDKTVAVLGLAFKPDTDDIRYSPAMDIIDMLINKGARVKAYDPQAMIKAKNVYKKNQRVTFGKSLYDTVKGVQAVVIVTDWDEFRYMDLVKLIKLMKHPIIVDGRNMFDPAKMKTAGFIYKSIGRN